MTLKDNGLNMDIKLLLLLVCMFQGKIDQTIGFFMVVDKEGELLPNDPLVVVGSSLVLNCTILKSEQNSSQIEFFVGNKKIDHKFVHIVSEKMAQLVIPNMRHGKDPYYCKWPGLRGTLSQHAQAAYLPSRPENITCVNHNWQNMSCAFSAGQQDPLLVATFDFLYNIESPITEDQQLHCPSPEISESRCDWLLDDTESSLRNEAVYYIQVTVKTLIGSNSSKMIRLIPADIVKPDKVVSLSGVVKSSTEVRVSWQSPANRILQKITYVVKAIHPHNQKFDRFFNTSDTDLTVHGLKPYSLYTISVQARPSSGGFLSDVSSVNLTTLTDVPSALPNMTQHGFQIQPIPGNPNHVTAAVFWKKMDQDSTNGILKEYRVTTASLRDITNISIPSDKEPLMYQQELDVHQTYALSVSAASDKGFNESLQQQKIVISPSTRVAPPEKIVAFYWNNSAVLVNWTHNADAEEYVVFWCYSDLPEICEAGVGWQRYDKYSHSAIHRPENRAVMYAVSVRRNGLYSGMSNWTRCLYIYDEEALPPTEVKPSKQQEGSSLALEWRGFGCGQNLYVIYFIIRYCQLDHNQQCSGKSHNVTVDGRLTKYSVHDLEADKTYRMWMYSVAPSGVSARSDPVSAIIKFAGLRQAVVGGVVVGVIFGAVMFSLCLYMVGSKVRKHQKKSTVQITVPPRVYINEMSQDHFDEEELTTPTSLTELVSPNFSKHQNGFYPHTNNISTTSTRETLSSTDTMLSRLSSYEGDPEDDVFVPEHQRAGRSTLTRGSQDRPHLQPVPEERTTASHQQTNPLQDGCTQQQRKWPQPAEAAASTHNHYHKLAINSLPPEGAVGPENHPYQQDAWPALDASFHYHAMENRETEMVDYQLNSNNSNSYLEILSDPDSTSEMLLEVQPQQKSAQQYISMEELNTDGGQRSGQESNNRSSQEELPRGVCTYAELASETYMAEEIPPEKNESGNSLTKMAAPSQSSTSLATDVSQTASSHMMDDRGYVKRCNIEQDHAPQAQQLHYVDMASESESNCENKDQSDIIVDHNQVLSLQTGDNHDKDADKPDGVSNPTNQDADYAMNGHSQSLPLQTHYQTVKNHGNKNSDIKATEQVTGSPPGYVTVTDMMNSGNTAGSNTARRDETMAGEDTLNIQNMPDQ